MGHISYSAMVEDNACEQSIDEDGPATYRLTRQQRGSVPMRRTCSFVGSQLRRHRFGGSSKANTVAFISAPSHNWDFSNMPKGNYNQDHHCANASSHFLAIASQIRGHLPAWSEITERETSSLTLECSCAKQLIKDTVVSCS